MCGGENCYVQEKLNKVQRFLEPLKPLANAHMSSYITKNYWELLPYDIKNEASLLPVQDLYALIWNWGSDPINFHKEGAIGAFLRDCWSLSLSSFTCHDIFAHSKTCEDPVDRPTKCMSRKKDHEISNLKETVAALCEESQSDYCVIDVGGGKGYLGSSLALEKKIKVLSVDSKPTNTEGAITLFEKIEKNSDKPSDVKTSYKQITAFVTPETDIHALTNETFGSAVQFKVCLTGLHVCGDLASTCVRLFLKNQDIVSLCTVGCCYNLLTEAFMEGENPRASSNQPSFGFPLSSFLNKQQYILGRNARMIACQSLDRICREKRMMTTSIFWRAVLQMHLERIFGPNCELSVGRRCSNAESLSDYFLRAENSLKRNLELTENVIKNLAVETHLHRDRMAKFYCFRLALAPVVETLLVLDKLLYLHEQGVENAHISKVFDGVKSPRCYAVIAKKETTTAF